MVHLQKLPELLILISMCNPFAWLKKLYHWCMAFAEHPKGVYFFAAFATVEAFIFPIPVDPLLVAMGAAKPQRAIHYAALGIICSVAGAFVGYAVGLWLWDSLQVFFISPHFSVFMQKATTMFQDNTFMAMFLSGFTFLPFKVFTITAGISKVALWPFFWGSVVGRSSRFLLLAIPLYFFGEQIQQGMERHFEKVTVAVFILVVLCFYLF